MGKIKKAFKNFGNGVKHIVFYDDDEEVEEPEVRKHPVAPDIPFKDIDLSKETLKPEPLKQPAPAKSDFVTLPNNKPLEKPEVKVEKKETPYKFTQVISPIYGVQSDGQENKPLPPVTKVNNSNYISPLGTILSPMYGPVDDNKNQPLPKAIADLGVPDLLEKGTAELSQEKPEKTYLEPEKKDPEHSENFSMFDDEEQ